MLFRILCLLIYNLLLRHLPYRQKQQSETFYIENLILQKNNYKLKIEQLKTPIYIFTIILVTFLLIIYLKYFLGDKKLLLFNYWDKHTIGKNAHKQLYCKSYTNFEHLIKPWNSTLPSAKSVCKATSTGF